MSFISGLSGLAGGGGGGGLASLAKEIPVVGKEAGALAPLAGIAASLIPGGQIAAAALDVAGGIASKSIDAKKDDTTPPAAKSIIF